MNSSPEPETLRGEVEAFLKKCRQPAVLEPGEDPFPLDPGAFTLEVRRGRLVLEVWDKTRNLARRILRLKEPQPGRLELVVERFGQRESQLWLVDLAHGRGRQVRGRGARWVLREQFRRFLTRQFPGGKLAELSTEANLEESLSPVYPRALVEHRGSAWAALACPPEAGAAQGVLTFALVWLDHLQRRRQDRSPAVKGLLLYLPQDYAHTTCLRLPFLQFGGEPAVFVYSKEGYADRLETADWGNLETRLNQCRTGASGRSAGQEALLERLSGLRGVEAVPLSDGAVSFRVRGLEFARSTEGGLRIGIGRQGAATEARWAEIQALVAELARLRHSDAADRGNPLYHTRPEAWLESQVRSQLERVDPTLLPAPLYGQVPAMAGGERGIIDLLGVDRRGRLAVLELKASEDIHFPLQALDYWMRVAWHLDRGEFSARGYFPGLALCAEPPRLLLVAPALDFHPKTEVILGYFAPQIEVERVGLAAGWRSELEVMFRLPGAERPGLL